MKKIDTNLVRVKRNLEYLEEMYEGIFRSGSFNKTLFKAPFSIYLPPFLDPPYKTWELEGVLLNEPDLRKVNRLLVPEEDKSEQAKGEQSNIVNEKMEQKIKKLEAKQT